MKYVPSENLFVLSRIGHYRLTKDKTHEDYMVWRDGKIIAQGGFRLMGKVFEGIEAQFAPVPEPEEEIPEWN